MILAENLLSVGLFMRPKKVIILYMQSRNSSELISYIQSKILCTDVPIILAGLIPQITDLAATAVW